MEKIGSAETAQELIPEVITECSIVVSDKPVCSSEETIREIKQTFDINLNDYVEVVNAAKEATGCETEKCVVEKVNTANANNDLEIRFKVEGPTGTNLLSNNNIDGVLHQFAAFWPDFYAYNFNMADYDKYSFDADKGVVINRPDSLATVSLVDLHKTGKRCAACVINSDNYHGRGKHWMALFADWRNPQRITIEFFNSSGNAPAYTWVKWMMKARVELETIPELAGARIDLINVAKIKHQKSRHECGVYSVFYIYARLNGVPVEYFGTARITDEMMFEFRQHIFDSDKGAAKSGPRKFDLAEFKRNNTIRWE
ncbi:cysteine protease [Faustovirus]|nr:cysteine protease [Faustovirus]